jgi:hypothetical protein
VDRAALYRAAVKIGPIERGAEFGVVRWYATHRQEVLARRKRYYKENRAEETSPGAHGSKARSGVAAQPAGFRDLPIRLW